MSIPKQANPAKLVIGVFLNEKELIHPVAEALGQRFGSIDMASRWMNFDFTNYYEKEMGAPLYRRLFAFKELIEQEALSRIKIHTNQLEAAHIDCGKRKVNIDPGYLLHERFVLATGKNFSHRIYIGNRIYADLTLMYKGGGFKTLPWTYPDYAHGTLISWLELVRKKYAADMKRLS